MEKKYKAVKHKAISNMKRQQGMTAISLVVLVAIGVLIILIALKLFPVYLENFKVKSHLTDLSEEADIVDKSDAEIVSTLFKRFQIDDVVHVKKENFYIERSNDGSMLMAIEYEVRTSALGNVDMVVSFVDEVEAR